MASDYKAQSTPISVSGNKTLHFYNGTIEILEGGFLVTFFYTGSYELTLTDDNDAIVYSGNINATAYQPIFISADVSPEEDDVEDLF